MASEAAEDTIQRMYKVKAWMRTVDKVTEAIQELRSIVNDDERVMALLERIPMARTVLKNKLLKKRSPKGSDVDSDTESSDRSCDEDYDRNGRKSVTVSDRARAARRMFSLPFCFSLVYSAVPKLYLFHLSPVSLHFRLQMWCDVAPH